MSTKLLRRGKPLRRLLGFLAPLLEDGATIMLLLFLSVAVVLYFVYAALAVFHPYPLDYGEAPLVDQAMRLAAGQNIYRPDLSSPPYTISNYPPLYPLSLVPSIWLFGPTFWAGRALSVLCALATAVFLTLIIHTHSRDRIAAITAGMTFLAIPYVVHWSALARVDLLALALSLAGLYALTRPPAAGWGMAAGALLLVGAIYTRQSYALAAPLAAFVWLWAYDRGQALRLAVLVGGLALALFLVLNLVTRGGFYFNLVTANVNEFGRDRLIWNLHRLRRAAPVLLAVGGGLLVLGPWKAKTSEVSETSEVFLLAPYLIGAFLSALTIGKIGSNVNYFLELSAALSLAAGAAVAWTQEHPWLRAAVLVLLALQAGQLIRTTLDDYAGPLATRRAYRPQLERLEQIVADAAGPVPADEYMGLITLRRRPLYIQPFEVTQLANAGLWDQTPFLESIRDRAFPLILIHYFPEYAVYKERWTPEMLSAISRAYVPVDILGDTRVYRAIGSHTPRNACPGAPWQLPTSGARGVKRHEAGLDFFGEGREGTVPVYAVADGLLTRLPDWEDAVAIQHDDPLRPGEKVWSYYAHMVDASGQESHVVGDFPPGSADVPVKAGQLLGYQGVWSGRAFMPMWMHLRFAVVRAAEDGSFAADVVTDNILDPSSYLGIASTDSRDWQPLRCQQVP